MTHILGVIQHRGAPPSASTLDRMTRSLGHDKAAKTSEISGPMAMQVSSPHDASGQLWRSDDLVVAMLGHMEHRPEGDQVVRTTQAEALASAWRQWGIDLVDRVRGDFAGAIYEIRTGNLHLIRDRTGIFQIFWARAEGRIAFATSPKALLELPWVSRELARDHLAEYLSFRVVHAPRTLLRDVYQLEPGHRLRFSEVAVRVQRYFRPTYAAPETPSPSDSDIIDALHDTVERAVRRQLPDQTRVGVYLSGGVASTAIAAAARAASRKLDTFTVTFAEESYPEFPFAGRVAGLLGMDHHTVRVSSLDIAEAFDTAVATVGHPVGTASLVLQFCLARAAAGEVDLVLTGDGADQLFGGRMLRKPASALRSALLVQNLPMPLRTMTKSVLSRSRRYRRLTVNPEDYALQHGIGGLHLFDTRMRRSLLLDEALVHPSIRTNVLEPYYQEVETDTHNAILHAFFRSQLNADILPRATHTSHAMGLDVGFPLLDHDVQRLVQVLPGSFKLRGMEGSLPTRWMLRSMLHGALPSSLVNRPDRGLPHPLADWLAGPGRLFTETRFQQLREDPLNLWHHTGLEAVKRGVGRQEGASHRMWALFILDAWARQVGAT